jgi:tetratricopeptide (TPR) repeat protein
MRRRAATIAGFGVGDIARVCDTRRDLRLLHALFIAWTTGCAAIAPTPLERATSLAREHREADAIRVLREHLACHGDDVQSRRLLVRVLALTGDLGAAAREVDQLSRWLGEKDPIPFIELGHAYELAHEYEKALELYDHASEIAPADPRGPRTGGMRAAHWGEVEWARPRLEEAARRGANDAEMWHALGLLRVHAKELQAAEEAYAAGLRADPTAAECHLGLATVAVLRDDAGRALAEYDAIVAQRPRFPPAHLGRAWALGRLGRAVEARAALAEAERLGAEPGAIAAQRRMLETKP